MKRTKNKAISKAMKYHGIKQADAILSGDWHLQETVPIARKDDFYEKQFSKLTFIYSLQKHHDCPILLSGDLFDYWKPTPMLLSKTMEHLPKDIYTIYGNHDLPQHNLDLAYKCGIRVLERAGKLKVLEGTHWNQKPESNLVINSQKILIWHTMTYQGKKPWPDCTDPKGATLLRKYPKYDLILTGHNHKPFVEKHEGRLLVNPGSIFRLSSDQINHNPRVYLWYADTNTVEAVFLPIEKNVISRKHIEIKEKRDERIDAFVTGLNTDWKAKMSFEENIERFRKKNKIKKSIMSIIYEAIN